MIFKPGDEDRMKHIENEIAREVVKYRENTETAIVVFALVRVARALLRKYRNKTTREQLLEDVAIPFLRGHTEPGRLIDSDVGGSLIN